MEPKVPDDIYKTHLENNRKGSCCGLCRFSFGELLGLQGTSGLAQSAVYPEVGRQPACGL